MSLTLPTPDYIWHEDPLDEDSCEMFKVSETGLVDTSDEIYEGGTCRFCTRLYTKDAVLALLEQVAALAESSHKAFGVSTRDHLADLIRDIK